MTFDIATLVGDMRGFDWDLWQSVGVLLLAVERGKYSEIGRMHFEWCHVMRSSG